MQISAFFFLDKIAPTKQITHLVKAKKPHAPTMNGGALAEEPPMPKLEFREK